jgi:hypothetical protein
MQSDAAGLSPQELYARACRHLDRAEHASDPAQEGAHAVFAAAYALTGLLAVVNKEEREHE